MIYVQWVAFYTMERRCGVPQAPARERTDPRSQFLAGPAGRAPQECSRRGARRLAGAGPDPRSSGHRAAGQCLCGGTGPDTDVKRYARSHAGSGSWAHPGPAPDARSPEPAKSETPVQPATPDGAHPSAAPRPRAPAPPCATGCKSGSAIPRPSARRSMPPCAPKQSLSGRRYRRSKLRPKSSPAGAQRGRTTPSARRPALAWVYRAGLTSGYYLLPSVGFLGHAQDFRPDLDARWRGLFIAACGRAADWGLKLHAWAERNRCA